MKDAENVREKKFMVVETEGVEPQMEVEIRGKIIEIFEFFQTIRKLFQ